MEPEVSQIDDVEPERCEVCDAVLGLDNGSLFAIHEQGRLTFMCIVCATEAMAAIFTPDNPR